MERSWGHAPHNGKLAEAKLQFSKKIWLPARWEGAGGVREKKRKTLRALTAPQPQPGTWRLPHPGAQRPARQHWPSASPVAAF